MRGKKRAPPIIDKEKQTARIIDGLKGTYSEWNNKDKDNRINKLEKIVRNPFFLDIYNTEVKFDLIHADPPWKYYAGDKKKECGWNGKAIRHYPTMDLDDICNMPIKKITAKNAALVIWTTGSHILDAYTVMEYWGFKPVNHIFSWHKIRNFDPNRIMENYRKKMELAGNDVRKIKEISERFMKVALDDRLTRKGMGRYTRIIDELVLLGEKGDKMSGKFKFIRPAMVAGDNVFVDDLEIALLGKKGMVYKHLRNDDTSFCVSNAQRIPLDVHSSVLNWPRGQHSEKPRVFFDYIEKIFSKAKNKLDMFSRDPPKGWYVNGNELINKKTT